MSDISAGPNHSCILAVTFDAIELAAERLGVSPGALRSELEYVRVGREVLGAFMQAADNSGLECPKSSVNANGALTCPFADEVTSAAKALINRIPTVQAADERSVTDRPTSPLSQLGFSGR